MALFSIGQTAALFDLNTSTLRYYDDRGLVKPASRRGGKRFYGPGELRKLALLQMLQRLNVDLEVAASLFSAPSSKWRNTIEQQIAALDHLLLEATVARAFLSHLLDCPSDHPTRDCQTMVGILDERVSGTTLEDLAQRYGLTLPTTKTRRKPRKRPAPH